MAVFALTGAVAYVGGYDLSGDLIGTSIEGTVETNDIDTTTFASGGWHERISGLHDVKLSGEGLLTYTTTSESTLFGTPSVQPIIIAPTGTQGDAAELFRAVRTSIGYPETVGDAAKAKLDFAGSGQWVRGTMLTSKAEGVTNGNGTVTSIGATATTSKLYAVLQVFSVGTNVNVSIASGSTSGFGDATTRIQFDTATAVGAQWGTPLAGPVTDTYYRVTATSTGGAPSIAVGIGIL